MGFAFNPFTGNFDAKGSGGGGSSYIDGEVQNFSALPETSGTPPVDSAYLVREAEGAWLLSRKPAGIYIRTGNSGVRASDWTYAGEFPDVFSDDKFVLYDETDSSKNLVFQLSGLTTGTTSTLTVPASGTIARTEDFAAPPAIGNTTPNSGAFTTLSANTTLNVTTAGSTAAETAATLTHGRGSSGDSVRLLFLPRGAANPSANIELIANGLGGPAASMSFRNNATIMVMTSSGMTLAKDLGFSAASPVVEDITLTRDAADTLAQRRTTNPQTFRLYTTYASTTSFERLSLRGQTTNNFIIATEKGTTGGAARGLELQTDSVTRMTLGDAGGVTIADANDIAVGTTTGTKIGTATTQKIGFFNATPVVQQAAIADATDAATTQARLNDLLATMRTFGLIAT